MTIATGEQPADLLARIGSEAPPEILQIFEDARTAQDAVRSNSKYTDAAKAELLREIEAEGVAKFEKAFERVNAARQKELDQQEGQLRAALRNDPPPNLMGASDSERFATMTRTLHEQKKVALESNVLAVVKVVRDIPEIARLFNECEGRGQELAMTAAVVRCEALAETARRQSGAVGVIGTDHPETRIARDLRNRLTEYRKAHPSEAERLQALLNERQQRTHELERRRKHWYRVYGWTEERYEVKHAKAMGLSPRR